MYQSTPCGQFLEVHPRLAALLGYDSPDQLKHAIIDIASQLYVDPEARQRLLSELEQRGEIHRHETELYRRDGSRLRVAIYARGDRETDGRLARISGAVLDIGPLHASGQFFSGDAGGYREFFEHSTIGMYRSRPDGCFVEANRALAQMLGYDTTAELLTEVANVNSLYAEPAERGRLLDGLRHADSGEAFEFRLLRRDGRAIWVREHGRAVCDPDGAVRYFEGTVQDISTEREALAALKQSEERYRALVDNSQVGVFVNQEGIYTYVNPAFAAMLGYSQEELTGKHFRSVHAPESLEEAEQRYRARQQGRTSENCYETVLLHRNGQERIQVVVTIGSLEHDGVPVTTGTVTDIREQKRIERRLRHNATHDPLTGLPNRSLFLERLKRSMHTAGAGSTHDYAVCFLDLDGFKIINDSLGHAAGDLVLQEIAQRIRALLRPWDMVSRHGGDEFTLLLENIDGADAAQAFAQRLHDAVSAPLKLSDIEVYTNASIGIVMGSPQYQEPEELLRDADTAMYSAKAGSHSGIALFDSRMHEVARWRLQLETDLRLGIERQEFHLYYQPIRDLRSQRILGFEALLRWHHPQLGLLLPGDFLAVVEETGMIIPLGWRLLEQALEQLTRWQHDLGRPDLFVSVNIAHRQFHHPQLVEKLRRMLRASAIEPGTLHLELTENIFMDNPAAAIRRLQELRKLGTELLLDDFGTGYSSFGHLHQYAIDTLKIDRSFVAALAEDPGKGGKVLESIVKLARALGMELIAEGIETPAQLHALRKLGVRRGQGKLLGSALAGGEAGTLLLEPEQRRWWRRRKS